MANPIPFGIVGGAWRSEFFLRVAQARPDLFACTGVVTRSADRAAGLTRQFGVRTFDSLDALLSAPSSSAPRPMFVVTSVPRDVNPRLIRQAMNAGMPVLSETPPAGTVDELNALWRDVHSRGGKVQVAEQLHLQPHHAARIALARSGKLGRVSQAQVSVAHGYHGISLIRRLLGVTFENARISGIEFTSPIIEGPGRDGPPKCERVIDSKQIIVTCDFGDRLGVLDFVGDQYFSPIRGQRVLVRGERGEIVNDSAVYLKDFLTPIRASFIRHEAGHHGNLEGLHLKGIQLGEEWIYHNPLAPARLTDEEVAVGTCLLKMAEHVRSGKDFYPLAEACQDTYLDLLTQQAVRTRHAVTSVEQTWSGDSAGDKFTKG